MSAAVTVREAARAAYNRGDFETAIGAVQGFLGGCPDDEVPVALLRCDLVRYLYLKGLSREADEQLRLAGAAAQRHPGEVCASWLVATAWLRVNSLEFEQAREAAIEALAIARSHGLRGVEAETLGQLAVIEVQIGDLETGLAQAEEALAAARSVPDADLVAEITINVSASIEARGDREGAITYLRRGESELTGIHDVLVADFLTLCLAQLLAQTEQVPEAQELLQRLTPARLDGVVGVFFRIVQAEIAVAIGDLSAAMLWIDGIDVSGWAYSDQWNSQLDQLLDVIGRGFDAPRA